MYSHHSSHHSKSHDSKLVGTFRPSDKTGLRAIFLIVVFFTSYGSLYPFDFSWHAISAEEVMQTLLNWHQRSTRGDMIGNVLLFIPYGFFGQLGFRRSRMPLFGWIVTVILSGWILAFILQALQLYVPSRVASLKDTVLNGVGITLGVGLGLIIQLLKPRRFVPTDFAWLRRTIPLALMGLWVLSRWFPFAPSFDWQSIKNNLKPLWYATAPWGTPLAFTAMLHDVVAWLCFYYWLTRIMVVRRHGWPLARTLILTTLFIFSIELLIVNNSIGRITVCSASIAIFLHLLLPYGYRLSMVCTALFMMVFWVGLSPWEFTSLTGSFEWIPFGGFLSGSFWYKTQILLEKLFLYGSMLVLMRGWSHRWWLATLITSAWLAMIECLQIWTIGHTAEITDPLLVILLGIAMRQFEWHSEQRLQHQLVLRARERALHDKPKSPISP